MQKKLVESSVIFGILPSGNCFLYFSSSFINCFTKFCYCRCAFIWEGLVQTQQFLQRIFLALFVSPANVTNSPVAVPKMLACTPASPSRLANLTPSSFTLAKNFYTFILCHVWDVLCFISKCFTVCHQHSS